MWALPCRRLNRPSETRCGFTTRRHPRRLLRVPRSVLSSPFCSQPPLGVIPASFAIAVCPQSRGRALYPLSRYCDCPVRIVLLADHLVGGVAAIPSACCHQACYSVVKEPKRFTVPSDCPNRSVPLRLAATRSVSCAPSVAIASLRPHAAPLPLGDHRVPDTPVSPGNGQIGGIYKVQAVIPCIPRICIGLRGIWSLHLARSFVINKARQTDQIAIRGISGLNTTEIPVVKFTAEILTKFEAHFWWFLGLNSSLIKFIGRTAIGASWPGPSDS